MISRNVPRGRANLTAFAWLALALLGCGDGLSSRPPGFEHSAATSSCGPADGPAVVIFLSGNPVTSRQPASLHVRIWILESVSALEGETWSVGTGAMDGSATMQMGSDLIDTAVGGGVHVSSVDDDNTVTGTVDITFPEFGRIRGGFSAHWLANPALCG